MPYVIGAFNISDAGLYPHSPVRLIFGSKPRQDQMRTMKVPKSHPVDLPEGPQMGCVPSEVMQYTDEELGGDYGGCVMQLEKELCQIRGLDEEEAEHFNGRTDGPEFVMTKVAANKAAAAKTTSASRAWRRAAVWLAQVGKAKGCKDRLAACWKLFNYKHSRPNPSIESVVQREAFRKFEAWMQVVASVQLDDHWVKVFTTTAKQEAEKQ